MGPVVNLSAVLVGRDVLLLDGPGAVDVTHPVGDLGVLGVHEVTRPVVVCHLR